MTVVGAIIAILGAIAFLLSSKWLYRLLIWSVPFSATDVISTGIGHSSAGMQVWMYFGLLWLVREVGLALFFPSRAVSKMILHPMSYVMLFTLVLGLSLLMPVYINGSLEIFSPYLLEGTKAPLYFAAKNLTQWLYVVFGCLLVFALVCRNQDERRLRETERLYFCSGLIAVAFGLVDFISHVLNVASPTLALATNYVPDADFRLYGLSRIASVTVEPSILAQFLLSVLPLAIPGLLGMGFLFSKKIDRIGFCAIVLMLLLSTSTTAYLMLLIMPLLCLPAISKLRVKIGKFAWYSAGALLAIVVLVTLFYLSPAGYTLLNNALFSKADSYSAAERLMTVTDALGYFKQYPLLGVGWGSVTSHDLIAMTLASSGLIGLGAFALMIFQVGRPLYRRISSAATSLAAQSSARWWMAGVMLLAASVLSEFPFTFGHMWIVLAMAIAAGLPERHSTDGPASLRLEPIPAVSS